MNAPMNPTGTFVSALTEDSVSVLSVTNTFVFTDLGRDLGAGPDAQGLVPPSVPPGALGTFSAVILDSASGQGSGDTQGTIQWSFSVNSSDVQFLGAGETLVQVYTITIVDLDGNELPQDVTITIHGTNDVPVITSSAPTHAFGEDSALSVSSFLAFTDADITDTHSVSSVAVNATGVTAGLALDTTQLLALLSTTVTTTAGTQTSASTGTINYTFTGNSADFQYLAEGEVLTLTYSLTLSDGETGGTTTRDVVITVTGTNDAPTLAPATLTYTDTSADDFDPTGVTGIQPQDGTLAGADADASDDLDYAFVGPTSLSTESGYDVSQTSAYGTLHLNLETGAYRFIPDVAAIQSLTSNATVNFLVSVDDGSGPVSSTLSIAITATNDAADITGTATGTVTEAGVVPGNADASGNLDYTDRDGAPDVWNTTVVDQGDFGTLTIDADGVWNYALNNGNPSVDALNNGETLNDTIVVATADGTQRTITITINGANDASISAGSSGTVGEAGGVLNGTNATPSVSGNIDHTDVDNDDDVWQAGTVTGLYGSLVIGADGAWTYTTNQSSSAVQSLDDAGDTLTDTFTVMSGDGTEHQIVVTITGADDAAVVTGDISGNINEAGGVANGTDTNLVPGQISGNLDHTDVDGDDLDDAWTEVPPVAGLYGTFTLGTNGQWIYILDNNNTTVQGLNTSSPALVETFTVQTTGGTSQVVTINIQGTNDAAVITGTASGSVTEAGGVNNAAAGTPTVTGDLAAADVDNTPDLWVAQTGVADTYGTFSITSAGVWTYMLDNGLASTQALDAGDVVTRTFTVATTDGTETTVTVTINGANDAPTGVVSVAGITAYADAENAGTEVRFADTGSGNQGVRGGTITVTDVDASAVLEILDANDNGLDAADVTAIRTAATFEWLSGTTVLGTSTGLTSGAPTTGGIATAALSTGDRADILNAFDITSVTQVTNAQGLQEFQINWTFDGVAAGGVAGITIDSNGTLPLPTSIGTVSVNFLGAGESLRVTFPVTVVDQHGAQHVVNVPIVFTGANDAPTGTENWSVNMTEGSGSYTGTGSSGAGTVLTGGGTGLTGGTHTIVVNDPSGTASDVNATLAIGYNDGDRTDTLHTVNTALVSTVWTVGATTPTPPALDYLSFMTPSLTQRTEGAGGQINWTFTAPDSAFDFLAAGEILTIVYRFNVTDENGLVSGGTGRTITVTITGDNDVPTIDMALTGAVTEDGTSPGTSSVSGELAGTLGTNWDDLDVSQDAGLAITAGSFGTGTPTTTLTFDTAPGGGAGDYAAIEGTYGTLYLQADGSYIYVLDNSRPATQALTGTSAPQEVFNYTIRDASNTTATSTLTITVNGANDAPTLTAVSEAVTDTAAADSFANITGTLSGADVDAGDVLSYGLAAGEDGIGDYGTLTVNADGTYTYDVSDTAVNGLPAGTFLDTFTVRVTDAAGAVTTQTFTVAVTGANDTPEAQNGTATATEDAGAITIDVASLISDRDAAHTDSVLVVTPSVPSTQGTVTVSGTVITFTPATDFFGTATITYTVSDPAGGVSTPATIAVNVAPVADTDQRVTNATLDSDSQSPTNPGTLTIGTGNTASGFVIATDAADAPGVELGLSTVMRFTGTATIDAADPTGTTYVVQAGAAGGTVNDGAGASDDGWARWNIVLSVNADTDDNGGTLADLDYRVTISTFNGTEFVTSLSFTLQEYAAALNTLSPGAGTAFLTQSLHQDMINLEWSHIAAAWGTTAFDPAAPGLYRVDLTASTFDGVGGAGPSELLRTTIQVRVNSDVTAVDDVNGADAVVETGLGAPGDATATGNVLANDEDPDLYPVADETELAVTNVTFGTTTVAAGAALAGAYGSLTLGADGTWTYTLDNGLANGLAAGQTVTEVFTYTVTDPDGETDTATLTITITGSNDAPMITTAAVTAAMNEGLPGAAPTPLSGTLAFTDVDVNDRPGSAGNVSTAGAASLTTALSVTGASLTAEQLAAANALSSAFTAVLAGGATNTGIINWTFAPSETAVNFLRELQTATLTFTVTLNDGNGGNATQTVTITLTGTNDAVALGVGASDLTGEILELADGNTSTAALETSGNFTFIDPDLAANPVQILNYLNVNGGPSQWGGTLTRTVTPQIDPVTNLATGQNTLNWTYSIDPANPNLQALGAGETLTETFTIRVLDQSGAGFLTRTITVTLTGSNDRPVISAGVVDATVVEGSGTATLEATGSISFTDADVGVGGTVADLSTASSVLDSLVWAEGESTLAFDVNDLNVLSSALEAAFELTGAGVSGGANAGTVTWSLDLPTSAVDFLAAGETLTVTYRITITDDSGDTSTNTATQNVVITITGTNDGPMLAGPDAATVAEAAETTDAAVNAGNLTAAGSISYSDVDATDTHTVDVFGVTVTGDQGTVGNEALLDLLTASVDALNGEIDWSFSGSEALFDHLDAGDTLVLNYTIILTDSANATISTTVTITIQGADDTPFIVAAGTTTEGEVTENGLDEDQAPVTGLGTATGTIVADDVDAGAVLEFSGNAEGSYGTFSVDAETGVWTYVLDQSAANNLAAGATETETFTVTVSDGVNSVTRNVTITINGTNDGPTIDFGEGEDQGSVEEDVTASASGTLGGGIDPDTGAVLTWSITNDSPYGTMSIDPDTSEWTFTLGAGAQALNEGDEVVHVFTATVTDEHGATASVPVTITITGTNDLPVVTTEEGGNVGEVEEPGERSVANGGTITGDLSVSGQLAATDADDGETATLVWSTTDAATYGTFTLNSNGSWTYTLDPAMANALAEGDTRTETFDIIVTDAVGGTSTETVTVTIQGTNDAPVINLATSQATGTVTEASIGDVAPVAPSTATGSLVATDVDAGDVLTWSVVGGGNGTYGTMSVSGATWTYTLDDMRPATQALSDGDVRTDSFTLRVTDSAGVIRDITVAVTVNGRHEVFTGTSESEVISGTGNADSISGLGGDDTLSGGIGNDQIFGGDGDDSLVGGTGDDLLVGGTGSDIAEGLSGNDTLALEGDWDDYDITLVGSTYQFLNTLTGDLDRATLVEFVTFNDGPAVAIAATLNDAPVAVADSGVTTAEDTAVSISIATLLANDTDADILPGNPLGEALTLTSVTSGTGGTVAIVGTNVVFTPTTNYHGPASFTYTVTDVNGATTTGTVSLTVTPVNDAPVVADATASGTEDAAITGTVVGTDVDVEPLTYALVAPVAGLTFNADGTWSFDPAAHQGLDTGESATVTFQYVANDGTVNSAPATVTITVNGANDAPVVADATASGTEDAAITGTVVGTDVDVEPLTYALVAPVAGLTFNADGTWSFDPAAHQGLDTGESATVTFQYVANDGTVNSAPATVTITVNGANDAPVVADATASGTEDAAITGTVVGTDVDVEALTYALVAPVAGLTFNADGTWSYDPAAHQGLDTGESATVTFQYVANDGTVNSAPATVTITVNGANDAPTGLATAELADGTEDTAYTVSLADLLDGFSDVDGDELSVTGLTASNGTAVENEDGSWTITPTADFNGTVTLSYSVTDGTETVAGSLSYDLAPVNDAPEGAPGAIDGESGTEDTAYTVSLADLLAGFSDADGDELSVTGLTTSNGTAVENEDGSWTITPTVNFNGTVTLSYSVTDGLASVPTTFVYDLTPVNDAPTGLAAAELADGTEDTAYTVSLADLLDGFSDVDGDDLSVTGLTASNGTAVENEDGSWTITPTADFNGTVTLSYSVTDGTETVAGSLSYDLAPVNDAPDVLAPIADQTVAEDTAFTFTFTVPSGTFGDPDGDALTYSLGAGSPTWLSIDGTSGQITGTPPADFTGDVAVTVIATDPSELSTSFTFTLTVTPVNDAPDVDVTLPPLGLAENAAAGTVAATLAVTDIDNDPGEMSLSLVGDAGGRFVLSGNDIVVADPVLLDFEQATSHDVTVQVSDGNGGVTTRTITINLTDVAPENVVGGAGSDRIVAATGADTLQGNGGNDTLVSGAGADLLDGGDGNDMLVGGAGGDSLIGGVGTRDQANYADATAGLRADLQVATFNTGFAAGDTYSGVEDLFGSALGDTLLGDSGANIIWGDGGNDAFLDGRVGNDTIYGGTGNDVLIGGWGGDLLDGGTGSRDRAQYTDATTGLRADLQVTTFNTGIAAGDTYTGIEDLFGSFQSDSLLGNTEGNIIWGAAGNDLIDGRLGNDTLLGGAGNDTLVGGGGADVFIFDTALGATNVDSIQGYSAVDDTIQLENAIFTALTETGVLAATAFVTGAAATSADHRIIYNSATGELLYDADGTGASGAVHFATLAPGLAITNSDFVVI